MERVKEVEKKGLSPVIATVLLIAIVIILGLIVFMWLRGITQEAVTKFGGKNVQIVCDDAKFDAQYSGGMIYLSNTGNVPIYKFKAKISGEGTSNTVVIGDGDSAWPKNGLNQGGVYTGSLDASGGTSILIIPVLIGQTSAGDKKTYTCEDRQGKTISV